MRPVVTDMRASFAWIFMLSPQYATIAGEDIWLAGIAIASVPSAGSTRIRFKGSALRHLNPYGLPSEWPYCVPSCAVSQWG